MCIIVCRTEAREKGFTVLLLAENEADYKMIEVLDKSVCLLGNCIKINRFLIWTPGVKSDKGVRTLASQVEVSTNNHLKTFNYI